MEDLKESQCEVKYTTILRKYPSLRSGLVNGSWKWLAGRRKDDNAEGLWRVHDKIYDLENFAENHPGGKEWITLTKGIDITEAFESYHIRSMPSDVLKKFLVKEAELPRNYMLTYEENGFYRVLKRRVAEMLPTLDKSDLWRSKLYMDLIVLGLFCSIISAVRVECTFYRTGFLFLSGLFVSFIHSAAHNFTHQRNNWRMYTSCLIWTGWRDYRIFHAISHHLYPNTLADLECSLNDPYIIWLSNKYRSKFRVAVSWFFSFVMYFMGYHWLFLERIGGAFLSSKKYLFWFDALGFIPAIVMYLFDSERDLSLNSFLYAFYTWNLIIMIGSFTYHLFAVSAGHHATDIVHEGDELRSLDFGIFQMSSTFNRFQVDNNQALTLVNFGNHVLHHLFPSLDHALLPQLRNIFHQTCKEFDVECKEYTIIHAFIEQFKQLCRNYVTILYDNKRKRIRKYYTKQDQNNNL